MDIYRRMDGQMTIFDFPELLPEIEWYDLPAPVRGYVSAGGKSADWIKECISTEEPPCCGSWDAYLTLLQKTAENRNWKR